MRRTLCNWIYVTTLPLGKAQAHLANKIRREPSLAKRYMLAWIWGPIRALFCVGYFAMVKVAGEV